MIRYFNHGSRLLLATVATLSCVAYAAGADDDPALEEVRTKMSAMFEAIEPQNINASPVDGWYVIQQGSIVAYVSDDGRYLLQGDLIDLETQVNLTEQSRNSARRDSLFADRNQTLGDDFHRCRLRLLSQVAQSDWRIPRRGYRSSLPALPTERTGVEGLEYVRKSVVRQGSRPGTHCRKTRPWF